MELALTTLIAAIEFEGLGEPHAVLAGAERFISRRVKHHADRVAWDELSGAGLTRGDRLRDDFRDTLVAIQRASVEYYGWVTDTRTSYAILAASIGPDAVVLAKTGDSVHLERLRPGDMIGAFVAQLPDVPPARGAPIRVPPPGPAPQTIMARVQSTRDSRRKLEAVMRQPRIGGAKLYGARRDHLGARQRSANWITVVDAQSGRWVTSRSGDGTVNAVPGTRQVLVSKLMEL